MKVEPDTLLLELAPQPLRARTTDVMSASMTVVACGAVCLLSTMCLAMAWRIGESGRSSLVICGGPGYQGLGTR